MGREIKYRGLTEEGQWVYGDLIHMFEPGQDVKSVHIWPNDKPSTHIRVRPETVGQYTGLKDKEGREIYEGDILSGHDDGYVEVQWSRTTWDCVFSPDASIGLDEMCIWFGNNALVIGNIHTAGGQAMKEWDYEDGYYHIKRTNTLDVLSCAWWLIKVCWLLAPIAWIIRELAR